MTKTTTTADMTTILFKEEQFKTDVVDLDTLPRANRAIYADFLRSKGYSEVSGNLGEILTAYPFLKTHLK